MVYKCPKCGSDLEYSVETNSMVCRYCETSFDVNDVAKLAQSSTAERNVSPVNTVNNTPPVNNNDFSSMFGGQYDASQIGDYNTLVNRKKEEAKKIQARSRATIAMQIMKCTSCGGELAVNGVEASTFCPYCGQATIILDRMEDYLQPDYIIPFKIPKSDAERIIRDRMNAGFFIPKKLKSFEVEKLRGIYIPFWLHSLHYDDRQWYKYTVKRGKSTVTRYALRAGYCDFEKFTVDASKKLNDISSSRLEPYDMRQLKEFDSTYMAGYYSDRFDVGIDESLPAARQKAGKLFDEEMKDTVKHSGAKLVSKSPRAEITHSQYALLPAWFLTFRQEGQQYTILVNGQTGKMVGAFPFDKAKAAGVFIALFTVASAVIVPICTSVTRFMMCDVGLDERATWLYLIILVALVITGITTSFKKYKKMKESISLTRNSDTNEYVKERQSRQ